MKFGQFIEYNMRNIFLEKSYSKCVEETIPRHLFKKIKIEYMSEWIVYSCIQLGFIVCQFQDYRNILKLSGRPLAFTSYKFFKKNKKRCGTSLPASFSAQFLKKNISLVISYGLTKFHCLVVFTLWNIGQYVYCNCFLTRLWRHKFWN